MQKMKFIIVVYKALLGIMLILTSGCHERPDEVSPNIMWIIAEDLSQDLGCYGNENVKTPNLDQLAQKGMIYHNVFTTSAVCAPVRTALATGMYQTSIDAYHMRYPNELLPPLPNGILTVFQVLKQNGYVTANIKENPGTGKNDWMFKHNVEDHFDFDKWNDIKESEKPFVAQVNIKHTHRPFSKAGLEEFPNVSIPPYYPDNIVSRTDWANYYKSIETLDSNVGQVLEKLIILGLDQNTIVIFMGDHGRPMTRGKTWLYDSGIKIPFLIHVPDHMSLEGYKAGSGNEDLISSIDITATLLELAGITKPDWMQGEVMLGGNMSETRTFIYGAVDRVGEVNSKSRCIRTKDFKLIRNYHHNFSINEASTAYRKAFHPIYHLIEIYNERGLLNEVQKYLVRDLPYEEFYDLRNDPFEVNNLIADEPMSDQIFAMQSLMNDYLAEMDDKAIYTLDSREIIEAFKAYGIQSSNKYQNKFDEMHAEVLRQMKEK